MTADVCASVLSLAGTHFPGKPRFDPMARAQAAHAVGIPAIGVTLDELDDLPRSILRYARIPEAEWIDLGRLVSTREVDELRRLHEVYGVTRVNIGACDPFTPGNVAARNLNVLASAAPFVTFMVEPVAFGSEALLTPYGVDDVLIHAGDHDNTRILLDCWQVSQNGGLPVGLPHPWEKQVGEIQLCGRTSLRDIHAYPNPTHHERVFAGSQDRRYLNEDPFFHVKTLLDRYPDVPVSYEVPRQEHQHMTLSAIAERIAADLAAL